MAEAAAANPDPPASPVPPPSAAPESLLAIVQGLWRELPGLVSDRVDLLSLELQRAGIALAQMLVLVVVAAILGVTAWLTLWAGIVMALVAAGLPAWQGLAAVLVVNLLAIAVAIVRLRALLPRVHLASTRRHLMVGQADAATAAPHPAAA